MASGIKADIQANRGNMRSMLFVLTFRMSHYFTRTRTLRIIGFPIRLFYKLLSGWIYRIDLKDVTCIGKGFQLFHGGFGTVIGPRVVIGDNVHIRHNTTIGGKGFDGKGPRPVIGNNVSIGPGCIILGDIHIGDNACIGAGSIVVKDVEKNEVVAGNPARHIKYID
jgi:serine acetyltransferase